MGCRGLNNMTSRLTFADAENLLRDPHSCFKLVTTKKHVALLPRYIGRATAGILEMLNSEVGQYSDKLKGVLVAFRKVTQLQPQGMIITSQPYIHFDIQAEFIIFQPTVGSILKGAVNKIGHDYLGCLVHGSYNVSIPRREEGDGHVWPGSKFSIGQECLFEVIKVTPHYSMISLDGKLIEARVASFEDPRKGQKRRHSSINVDEDRLPDDSSQSDNLPEIHVHKRRRKNTDTAEIAAGTSTATDSPQPSTSGHKRKKSKSKRSMDSVLDTPGNLNSAASHGIIHQGTDGGSLLSDADSGIGIATPSACSKNTKHSGKKRKKCKSEQLDVNYVDASPRSAKKKNKQKLGE